MHRNFIRPHGGVCLGPIFFIYNNVGHPVSNFYPSLDTLGSMGKFGMYRWFSNMAGIVAAAIVRAGVTMVDVWRSAVGDQAIRYRPEAHYMRGPGPKWRAKHVRVSSRR